MPCTFNVGQSLNLTVNRIVGKGVGAVWVSWDGSTSLDPIQDSSSVSSVTRAFTLNRSGDVTVQATGVDELGRSSTASYSFYVNKPPIISNVTVETNYATLPYPTIVSASAVDPDSSWPVSWSLYYIDSTGTHVPLGSPSTGPVYSVAFNVTVPVHAFLTCTDGDGGETVVEFDLDGSEPLPVSIYPVPITVQPWGGQLIGNGKSITASLIVDAGTYGGTMDGSLSFSWNFWGNPSSDPGTIVRVGPTTFIGTIKRATFDAPPGRVSILADVTFTDASQRSFLTQLYPPPSTTVHLYKALPPIVSQPTVTPSSGVVAGTTLTYAVAASNAPSLDVNGTAGQSPRDSDGYDYRGGSFLLYAWEFQLPLDLQEQTTITSLNSDGTSYGASIGLQADNILNRTVRFVGPRVSVSTAGVAPGSTINGTLTVSTELGATVTLTPYTNPPVPLVTLASNGTGGGLLGS